MKKIIHLSLAICMGLCCACSVTRDSFDPNRKYPPEQLRTDYQIFRHILEESHPGLYWYASKESLDQYFDRGYSAIQDSMTETQFRILLSYVIARIDCGHTAVRYSKRYTHYLDTARLKQFPLVVKLWGDTMVVAANINPLDSVVKKGMVIKSIEGHSVQELRDSLFNYQVTDGYSLTGKFQSLSTGFSFGGWYKNIYGLPDQMKMRYLDSAGQERETKLAVYDPRADTLVDAHSAFRKGMDRVRQRRQWDLFGSRNLQVDTAGSTAFMTINTFSNGNHLKSFFRKGFRLLDEKKIRNLIIDVRSNGGGDATNSTRLTRYIIDKKFKLADSLYALHRRSRYGKYIEKDFFYGVLLTFLTHKGPDGKYHFGYFERHYFHPIRNHHYQGRVYVLVGGNSFSATSLFAGCLKGQKNVTLVGEETGGGYYGNSAWVIPDVTLPNTGIRFRLPKFRLVVDRHRLKDGRGVMPDVQALPSTEAIRRGIDFKAEKVRELIQAGADPNQ
jgi:hypothetical protein